jgi:hypothetical protein
VDTAVLRGGDLLLEDRVHDDRRSPAILQPPHGVEMIDERRCADHERVRQPEPQVRR